MRNLDTHTLTYTQFPPSPFPLSPHSLPTTSSLPQAIYVPADDLTDPAPATTFAHLDATTVLSRGIAELGIYPAVDPLDSTSRIMDPNIIGARHYTTARGVQKILQVGCGWGIGMGAVFVGGMSEWVVEWVQWMGVG